MDEPTLEQFDVDFETELVADHRAWLNRQTHRTAARNWENAYKVEKQRQTALHEAVVRRFLQQQGFKVTPNESPNGKYKAPDFLCEGPNGERFYVEATCISNDKVAEFSTIPDGHEGVTYFALLTRRLSCVPRNKEEQCANLDAPVLVAVGTFHSHALTLFGKSKLDQCLTGRQFVTWGFKDGKPVGKPHTATSHEGSVWFSNAGELECAPISALLFFRSAYDPPCCHGILNPKPNHAFNSAWFPNVAFGSVDPQSLAITWVQEKQKMTDEEYHAALLNLGWSVDEIAELKATCATHRADQSDDDI